MSSQSQIMTSQLMARTPNKRRYTFINRKKGKQPSPNGKISEQNLLDPRRIQKALSNTCCKKNCLQTVSIAEVVAFRRRYSMLRKEEMHPHLVAYLAPNGRKEQEGVQFEENVPQRVASDFG